jgi:hypothetical protein
MQCETQNSAKFNFDAMCDAKQITNEAKRKAMQSKIQSKATRNGLFCSNDIDITITTPSQHHHNTITTPSPHHKSPLTRR